MTADVFDTRAVRERVLGTWRSDPARFREDANTEDDHAHGYYRDRVVVELAQNAADAAARAGVAGRVLFRLTDDALRVANTGAPLTAAGVASMAAMRASTSRDDQGTTASVGRFGVGFAAVRAVADRVVVASRDGAVEFAVDRARQAVDAVAEPALDQEVRRREGGLPALRLPFATEGRPESGYDTTVTLWLRDPAAVAAVRAQLEQVCDPLLLALPALTEIVIEDETADRRRRIADVDRRWHRLTMTGELSPEVVADRPVEERGRRAWRITWAMPRAGEDVRWSSVVHAPTPTDDPLDLPALLIGTLPLDPTRRHVASGAATDALLDLAADVYARLASQVAEQGVDGLELAPVGMPGGEVDRDLRGRLIDRLAHAPLLPPVDGAELLPPIRALGLSDGPALAAALSGWFPGLVEVAPARLAAARLLGVDLRRAAELIEELPTTGQEPAQWRRLYAALGELVDDPHGRERLSMLPVPLSDGRVVRGARGLLLPEPGWDMASLAPLGLRLVHPEAAHPVLERLGATHADPRELIDGPAVRAAVLDSVNDDEAADEVSTAVLTLVRAAGLDGRDGRPVSVDRAVLGLLTLRDAEGEPAPANGLVLPGSAAARVLDSRVLGQVSPEEVDRWGEAVLTAVGVRAGLMVLRADDRITGDGPEDEADGLLAEQLDGWDEYREVLAEVFGPGVGLEPVSAVADLDAVHPDNWPEVLAAIARPGAARDALLDPVRSQDGPGSAPSYTAWWLRQRAGLDLDSPFAGPGADPVLRQLLPPAPEVLSGLDPTVIRALGGVESAADIHADDWEAILRAVARVGERLPVPWAAAVWTALESATDASMELLPALVSRDRVVLVHAEDVAVAPTPMWHQRTDVAAVLPSHGDPERLATVLDLPLCTELADGAVDDPESGELSTTPEPVRGLLVTAPDTWLEHEDLRVDGVPVDWWVEGDGPEATVHAVHLAGLARGLAQAAGRWSARHEVEALLIDPTRAAEFAVERVGDA